MYLLKVAISEISVLVDLERPVVAGDNCKFDLIKDNVGRRLCATLSS